MKRTTKTPVNPFGLPNIVIPAEVLFNKNLTWREKALFGFLWNLSNNARGYCWASNRYLAQLIDTRPDTVSGMVSNLHKFGYIEMEYEIKNRDYGSIQVRKITIDPTYPQKYKELLQGSMEKISTIGKITNPRENNQPPLGENPNTPLVKIPSNINSKIKINKLNTSSGEEVKNADQEKKITSSMFENFWLLYPRKIDKGKAKTKWEKMCGKPTKERPTWNEIESAIKVQINTTRWQDPKYIPHPTTWLNNQRWLDDPAEMGGAFNDAPSSSTPTNKPLTTQSPRRMIKEHFPKDLAKAFYHDCYSPAKALLNNDEGIPLNTEKLTRYLIAFHDQIKVEQGKNFTDELRLLLPGPIDLIQGYITWIEDRDWITNISVNLFDISHTLFRRFCRDEARKDNMERNPLTGRSYMRG